MKTSLKSFSISSSQSCGVSDVLGTFFARSWLFSLAPVTDDLAGEVLVSSLSFKAVIFLNPEAPLCLKEKFSFVSANSAHMTRGAASGNLVVPQPRTNSGKCMFSFTAAILFNALPLEIKQLVRTPLVSLNALISFSAFFKRKLRELFIQKLNSVAHLEELCCFACRFLLYCNCYFS